MFMRSALAWSTSALALGLFTKPAWAADPASTQISAAPAVAEIIVTSQKRATVLTKTPATINVITQSYIQSRGGAVELREVLTPVPSVVISDGAAGLVSVSVRGIGTASTNQLFEQSIGLFIDGVYNPKSIQYRAGLLDAERVEVIKGSQGVLFGKNTSVGAISIISTQPGDERTGFIEGRYEPVYGSWETTGAITLPVNSDLSIRLAGSYSDQEGYVENIVDGLQDPREKRWIARGIIRWAPTSNFTASLKLEGSQVKTRGNGFQITELDNPAFAGALGELAAGDTPYKTAASSQALPPGKAQYLGPNFPLVYAHSFPDNQTDIRSQDAALTLNYTLPGGELLTSITGYSHFDYYNAFDGDQTGAPIYDQNFTEQFHQTTEELRITSPGDRKFKYLAGVFLLDQRDDFLVTNDIQNLILSPAAYMANGSTNVTGIQSGLTRTKTDSAAAFAQVSYVFADKLTASVGLRGETEARKGTFTKSDDVLGDATSFLPAFSPVAPPLSAKIDEKTLDSSFNLSYQATSDLLGYFAYAHGTKSGAFNNGIVAFTAVPTPFAVKPQVANTYEVGAKLRFLDGAGFLGVAAYYLDLKDFQDSYYNSAALSFVIRSIDATSKGVEVDSRVRLTDWASVWGAAAYNEAKLANGEPMQRAPKWAASAGGRLQWSPDSDYQLFLEPTIAYSSDYLLQSPTAAGDNVAVAHTQVDARFGVKLTKSRLELSVLAENLNNTRFKLMSFGSPLGLGTVGLYNRPRTFTMTARLSF